VFNLLDPVFRVGAFIKLNLAPMPLAPVPEVSITKHDNLSLWKNNVRGTNQRLNVLPKAHSSQKKLASK
jgi:hypothetical protein